MEQRDIDLLIFGTMGSALGAILRDAGFPIPFAVASVFAVLWVLVIVNVLRNWYRAPRKRG